MKVVLLSSYTTDLLADSLRSACEQARLPVEIIPVPFGQFREQVIDTSSEARQADPDVVVLALRGEDMLLLDQELIDLLHEAEARFPRATLLVHNGVLFDPQPVPLLEWNEPDTPSVRLARLNARLHEVAFVSARIRLLDLDGLFRQFGANALLDRRMMYVAKHPFSADGTQAVTGQLAAALASLAGKRRKCIVLDLDNTLWGGILGEDGPTGILLSDDGPGKAYQDFQKALKQVQETGVLLAVCSKNDETQAIEVMQNHPAMILRPDNLAGWRINWDDKPSNLAALAEELNLGLDSFVFLDDSAHEQAFMRQALPTVAVPDFPADPADLPALVARLPGIDTLSVTDTDRQRTVSYHLERQRRSAREGFASMDDYVRSLDIHLTVAAVDDYALPRAAQLTQRTNQFNLTTRRYTEVELRALRARADTLLLTAAARDRFGDSGIVGLAIVRLAGDQAELDTFLISCRVLGRRIEDAFLASVLWRARDRGARTCVADYLPTERNGVAKAFLTSRGFQAEGPRFRRELASTTLEGLGIEVEFRNG
jgi:FkbH-like protein